MIPPEADAEFAASREEVLETYQRPYDAARCQRSRASRRGWR